MSHAEQRRPSVLWGGIALLVVSVVSYVSGLSRAVGVWLLPLGVAVTAVGWARNQGYRVPRWVYVTLVVVAMVLAVLGVATFIYALAHPPTLA